MIPHTHAPLRWFEDGAQAVVDGPEFIIFVVLCSVSILGVVLAERIAPAAVAARIPGVQTWLTRNNAVIMAGILLLIGFNVIGKGLARL